MFKMLQYPISSKFQALDQVHTSPHSGVDIATPLGTQVQSLMDGTVSWVGSDPTFGTSLVIQNGDKKELFGHLMKTTVEVGQKISTGEVIGVTGNTGKSTGPHLHVGLFQNGTPIDPSPILNQPSGKLETLWHFVSTPGTQLAQEAHQSIWDKIGGFFSGGFDWLVSVSDAALIIAIGFLLFSMFGSKKAAKGVYWTIASYFILHIINLALKGG